MNKLKFLIFLVFLGVFLYYFGKPQPLQSFTNDISRIWKSSEPDKKNEPWTREGRGDNVASDSKNNNNTDDVASDDKNDTKSDAVDAIKDKVETSIFDKFKEILNDKPAPQNLGDLSKYIPNSKSNTQIIKHKAFILNYQEDYELASWVLHKLTAEAANGTEARSNTFLEDPLVESGSAVTQDYSRSGYDRGHLCPAGDFKNDRELEDETFYMSNMSPQKPDFNRGIWSDMEVRVRGWAKARGNLIIVTGPILKDGLETIGRRNKIAVPEKFYKIVFDPKEEQAIAFLMPNEGSVELVKSFVVSIDEIERLTGIDFFEKLPDSLEKKLETDANVDDWF
jgi:endonuclease G, mitochondrial